MASWGLPRYEPEWRVVGEEARSAFDALRFELPLRRYQQMVLGLAAAAAGSDGRFHVVAPPGSGKTIVGIELIRRYGRPAVVFCPTTTIQEQWREKVGLFTDESWVKQHVSLDPRHLADISVLTYQVLSTPGENLAFVERVAIGRWIDDLLSSSKAESEAAARRRIATLAEANPQAHNREVARRYRKVKRELLRGGADGRRFLHPNANDLIDRIVALGTGTVVLDECHHLLDYWAFILRELLKALPGVRVVGLTATLPDPEDQVEYENYYSLLGDVDFEVPTPAVVKEGNLAPFRDLVYFCEPSPREHNYLRRIQDHFEEAAGKVTATPAFKAWVDDTLFGRDQPGPPASRLLVFEALFRREPGLCVAAVKYLLASGVPLPEGVPLIGEMLEPLEIDDWLTLLEHFGLRVLKVSPDAGHQRLFRALRDALLPFGISITEQGIRHGRSPGDLVLALSEAKDVATVEILRAEVAAVGKRLRAVVITDYERISARTRRLEGVLDPDAGSAVRVFRHLLAGAETGSLDPVLVTGQVVLAAAPNRERLDGEIRRWAREREIEFGWEWRNTSDPDIVRLAGSGRAWSSRTYVALLTDLFERGVTRCLVGTRGIFGEGWDALTLNTLVDLTSVTTRTGVQQIRGRAIRLDPSWPRKVAHNWDVVCVSRRFDKGDADLRRFAARHQHTWGVVMSSNARETSPPSQGGEGGGGLSMHGRVVRGVAHVDPELAAELATRDFQRIRYRKYTRQMIAAVPERDRVYDAWGISQPYENFVYSATRVDVPDGKFWTVRTLNESLRAIVLRLLAGLLLAAGSIWFYGRLSLPPGQAADLPLWLALAVGLTGVAVLGAMIWNAAAIYKVFRRTFLELPAGAILLDTARALLAALREAGLVSAHLDDNHVRVTATDDGGFEVLVEHSSPEDSNVFSRAYREMMGPLGDARYLIERDASTLRHLIYRPLWWAIHSALDLGEGLKAYHPVPGVLAGRRELAESLARHWARHVGGGRLVYTRTDEGRRILLQARAGQRAGVRLVAFEIWR